MKIVTNTALSGLLATALLTGCGRSPDNSPQGTNVSAQKIAEQAPAIDNMISALESFIPQFDKEIPYEATDPDALKRAQEAIDQLTAYIKKRSGREPQAGDEVVMKFKSDIPGRQYVVVVDPHDKTVLFMGAEVKGDDVKAIIYGLHCTAGIPSDELYNDIIKKDAAIIQAKRKEEQPDAPLTPVAAVVAGLLQGDTLDQQALDRPGMKTLCDNAIQEAINTGSTLTVMGGNGENEKIYILVYPDASSKSITLFKGVKPLPNGAIDMSNVVPIGVEILGDKKLNDKETQQFFEKAKKAVEQWNEKQNSNPAPDSHPSHDNSPKAAQLRTPQLTLNVEPSAIGSEAWFAARDFSMQQKRKPVAERKPTSTSSYKA